MLVLFIAAALITLDGVNSYSLADIQGKVTVRDKYPTTLTSTVFGSGYNTATLRRTFNKVVDMDRKQALGGFIQSTFKIQLCKSREEYFTSLSVGLGFTGTYMGVTGSVKVKVLTEAKISALDTIMLATVNAITDTQVAYNPRFTNESGLLLAEKKYQQFVEVFGTHYLRKVILGGKMVLVMKFSSSSVERKTELETALGVFVGTVGVESEFAVKMGELREKSSMELTLYAQGGNIAPPKPGIQEGFDYAVSFATNILTSPAVIEIEYTALWTLRDVPAGLQKFIFPVQGKTDRIVHIAVGLASGEGMLDDLLELKKTSTAHFSNEGWSEIDNFKKHVKSIRRSLQNDFKTISISKYDEVLNKFNGTDVQLEQQIHDLVKRESHYDNQDTLTLRSVGKHLYISTSDHKGYPRLDTAASVALNFAEIGIPDKDFNQVSYLSYIVIQTPHKPDHYLCMDHNDWYPKWEKKDMNDDTGKETIVIDRCQYRIVNGKNRFKKLMEYGDEVILYNRYWPGSLLGVGGYNDRWVECVDAKHSSDKKHHWYVGKSNF